ncbi:hypothetical protein BC830DRAFT_1227584 [Chytriomyces sp. MP71]|nr:hypothetical protein BC830DRAFT_1227584 [Chytriomyces sp. MP71]
MDLTQDDLLICWIGVVVTSLGLLTNLIVISANIAHFRQLPPASVLILCLCVSDSLLLSNYVSIATTRLIRGNLSYDLATCQIQGALVTFGALTSLGLCAGLTLIRYLIIVQQYKLKPSFTPLYVASVTAFTALVASIPFMIGAADKIYVQQESRINCTVAWYNTDLATRAVSWTCVAVLLTPLLSIGYAYYRIYFKVTTVFGAVKAREGVRSGNEGGSGRSRMLSGAGQDVSHGGGLRVVSGSQVQSTSDGTATHVSVTFFKPTGSKISQNNKISMQKRSEDDEKQMALLVQSLVVVCVFVVGWTPYLLFALIEILTGEKGNRPFEFAAEMFVSLQDGLNPLIVLVFDKKMRRNVFRTLGISQARNDSSDE